MAASHTAVAGFGRGDGRGARARGAGRLREAGPAGLEGPGGAGRANPRAVLDGEDPAWPAAAQVWNWAEGVMLSGYGPSAASFLA